MINRRISSAKISISLQILTYLFIVMVYYSSFFSIQCKLKYFPFSECTFCFNTPLPIFWFSLPKWLFLHFYRDWYLLYIYYLLWSTSFCASRRLFWMNCTNNLLCPVFWVDSANGRHWQETGRQEESEPGAFIYSPSPHVTSPVLTRGKNFWQMDIYIGGLCMLLIHMDLSWQ